MASTIFSFKRLTVDGLTRSLQSGSVISSTLRILTSLEMDSGHRLRPGSGEVSGRSYSKSSPYDRVCTASDVGLNGGNSHAPVSLLNPTCRTLMLNPTMLAKGRATPPTGSKGIHQLFVCFFGYAHLTQRVLLKSARLLNPLTLCLL